MSMPRYLLSGTGLIGFAAVSGFHFLSLGDVAGYHLPELIGLCAAVLILTWLGGLGLMLYAVKSNMLKECFSTVFLYVM